MNTPAAPRSPVRALDPLTLPLAGSRLIEASAGTGKTWTIAALYLRLVLGHGAEGERPARPLLPAEILVMSFTRAATRELSDRIRQRLVQAAAVFRGEQAVDPQDSFLPPLLAAYAPGAVREQAAWRLAMAAEAMDDAAVTTIDAWCQRTLQEHAFDSGGGFDDELLPDESALRAEAARDWWRQQVYGLSDEALALAHAELGAAMHDVDGLLRRVSPLLQTPVAAPAAPASSLGACIAAASQQRAQALAAAKQGWAERAETLLAELQALWARKDKPLNGNKLGQAHGTRWVQAIADWARDPAADSLDLKTGWERLTPEGFQAAVKPGVTLPTPPALQQIPALRDALAQLPALRPALLAQAAAGIAARLAQLKLRSGQGGFADQLQRLADALDPAQSGDAARRLRERIVAQYPAAMVDEFQDTSPVQLQVFDRLYRLADDDRRTSLLLIGDPKQAIYGFRGADIHSYLRARQATAGRHHALATNHRSTAALVQAVNTVFLRAEQRGAPGAFGFAAHDGDNPLPFVPVAARGRSEHLAAGAAPLPAMTLCLDATPQPRAVAREQFAALAAEHIVGLLNDPQAGFDDPQRGFERLRPRHIAVLVRTGTEAAAVRQALRLRGVASVYLSDRDSVFNSAEAPDLLRLLQAVAAPRDPRLARAALATPLMGLSLAELRELADDDAAFDRRCETLQQLHEAWRTQGVLAMLRRALHAFDLPARWLAQADPAGERRLTNVLHLSELLQAASEQHEGPDALLRWLLRAMDDAAAGLSGGDEPVLRLESDADLVQVITVHKSKGLEYPLVLLPFAADFRAVGAQDEVVFVPGEGEGADGADSADGVARHAVLAPDAATRALADAERLREDLRLLYVALTRARHALWVGLAALHDRGRPLWLGGAAGALISGWPAQGAVADDLREQVLALAEACDAVRVTEPPPQPAPVPRTPWRARQALPPLLPAPAYSARFDRSWGITSYSSLVRDLGALPQAQAGATYSDDTAGELATPLQQRLHDDDVVAPAEPGLEPGVPARPVRDDALLAPWHRFPRGAFAGNFLHGLLEWLAGEGSLALAESPALQQALRRRCERQGWGARADDVLAWLTQVLATPLPPLGCTLAQLPQRWPEMEFWLPLARLDAARVDALCREHLLPGRPRPALAARSLHGLLLGFADLVFEQGGRYGVLDHKSNALGLHDADYNAEALTRAVLHHRYDVQAALYLLALQRLLRQRLGTAYAPERHLHGATFLFLRGIQGPQAGCLHLLPPPALLQALAAMLDDSAGVAVVGDPA